MDAGSARIVQEGRPYSSGMKGGFQNGSVRILYKDGVLVALKCYGENSYKSLCDRRAIRKVGGGDIRRGTFCFMLGVC